MASVSGDGDRTDGVGVVNKVQRFRKKGKVAHIERCDMVAVERLKSLLFSLHLKG